MSSPASLPRRTAEGLATYVVVTPVFRGFAKENPTTTYGVRPNPYRPRTSTSSGCNASGAATKDVLAAFHGLSERPAAATASGWVNANGGWLVATSAADRSV